jgi:antitoxin VapB
VYTRLDVLLRASYFLPCPTDFGPVMALTRAFKSGNSQAVRIPAELAYEDMNVDLTISRDGDTILIQPARPSLRDMVTALRAMPKPSEVEVREPLEVPDRERD